MTQKTTIDESIEELFERIRRNAVSSVVDPDWKPTAEDTTALRRLMDKLEAKARTEDK